MTEGNKSARELLEESLSIITHPILELENGDIVTGWTGWDEFKDLYHYKNRVKILDPTLVKVTENKVTNNAVCAIGAIALANLAQNLNVDRDSYRGWGTQMTLNVQVAIATVALAQVIYRRKNLPLDYLDTQWPHLANRAEVMGLWHVPLKTLIDAAETQPDLVRQLAQMTVNVVTGWNDNDYRTWPEVAEVFTDAIKDLIKAEEEV